MPFVDVDGVRLHVIVRPAPAAVDARIDRDRIDSPGSRPRETLLLLHGLGSSAADWRHQLDRFATDFDVVAPDFPNHGESAKGLGGVSLQRLAALAAGALDALSVTGRVHVVGLSMGGCVALQLALDRPARVATLTVANSSADMRPRGLRVRLLMALRRPLFALLGMRRIGEKQADRLFPDPEDAVSKALSLDSWHRVSREDFLDQFDVVLRWHRAARLGELGMPVLAVPSEDDFSPTAWKRALAEGVPDGRLVTVPGRHMAPLEKPEPFDAALAGFLEAHPVSRPDAPALGAAAPADGSAAR